MEKKKNNESNIFQPGKPEKPLSWLKNVTDREQMLSYLKTAERYWFGEGFGSESRKTPA